MSLTLTLTKEQAIELLYQMPPEEKMAVLIELATQARDGLEEQMRYGESKVRQLCAKRGVELAGGHCLDRRAWLPIKLS